jgi:hypothetical protein
VSQKQALLGFESNQEFQSGLVGIEKKHAFETILVET